MSGAAAAALIATTAGALVETLIGSGVGTQITDFIDTNITAARDGNTNQSNTQAANRSADTKVTTNYGIDLGSGVTKIISGVKTWGANNRGYGTASYTGTIDIVLKASNTDPSTTGWTGTTIGTIAQFSNSAAVNAKQSISNVNSTGYRYVWVSVTGGSAIYCFLGEVEFYEWL